MRGMDCYEMVYQAYRFQHNRDQASLAGITITGDGLSVSERK